MRVLVTESGVHPRGVEMLKEHFDVDARRSTSDEELEERIGDYDALVIQAFTNVKKPAIDRAKRLKLIARAGSGMERVDVEYAQSKGIVVRNTPRANVISVAELAIGLMIAVLRKVVAADAYVRSKAGWDRPAYKGAELHGKTLGLIGSGNIGVEVAKRALVFGMKVIAFDPFVDARRMAEMGMDKADTLEALLRESDIVSIHVPLLETTRHMMGGPQFAQMKRSAVFINTCRGAVMDEPALVEALRTGAIAGAGVDAYEEEPPLRSGLLGLPNVVLTPHTGGITVEAVERMATDAAQIVIEFFKPGTRGDAR